MILLLILLLQLIFTCVSSVSYSIYLRKEFGKLEVCSISWTSLEGAFLFFVLNSVVEFSNVKLS